MRRASRWGMVCCLTLEWLALGISVGGGLVLIGAVIPAVFNTFGGQDSGGLFLTKAFEGYHRFMIGALAILWAALWYRWWSGNPVVGVGLGEHEVTRGRGRVFHDHPDSGLPGAGQRRPKSRRRRARLVLLEVDDRLCGSVHGDPHAEDRDGIEDASHGSS